MLVLTRKPGERLFFGELHVLEVISLRIGHSTSFRFFLSSESQEHHIVNIGESINLTPYIKLTVVRIERGQTRLGFDAPKSMRILREEITERDHPLRRRDKSDLRNNEEY